MFGNLSKSLIKAPHYFNNNIDTDPNESSKLTIENLLDTYSNIRRIHSRNNNIRYFKERDFLKQNLKLDLNYNNNFRKEITPHVRTKPCISFEEFISKNSKMNSKNTTKIFTRQSLYKTNKTNNSINSNLAKSVDSKLSKISENKDKFHKFLYKNLIPKNSIEEFDSQVKSNINNLITKINHNSLNLNVYENKFEKRKNRIENLKEYINKNTVVEAPVKLKFPDIYIKSNDSLYRDTLDSKINSLSMISSKIKEQLKSKNRVYASEKDYYRYNNSYNMYKQNPFYESVNYIEENKKKEIV